MENNDSKVYTPKYLVIDMGIHKGFSLSEFESFLFSFIYFYLAESEDKKFYFSNEQLACMFNKSDQTISNTISGLCKKELITTDFHRHAGGTTRWVELNQDYKNSYSATIRKFIVNKDNSIKTLSKDNEGAKQDFAQKGVPSKRRNKLSHKDLSRMAQRTGELNGTRKSPVKDKSPNSLIEYWNSLPGVRKHKNPNSKIYQQAVSMIRKLKRGTMFEGVHFNSQWLKDKKIELGTCVLSFSDSEEIKQVFKNLSLMYQPGYWPEDKSWLKGLNLCDLIYNPRARNSWFLAVVGKPPKQLSDALAQYHQGKDPYPRITADVKEFLGKNGNLGDRDMIQLLRGIGQLVKFHEGLPRGGSLFEYGDFALFCNIPKKFIEHYIEWLNENKLHKYGMRLFSTGTVFKTYLDQRWNEDSTPLYEPLSQYLSKDKD